MTAVPDLLRVAVVAPIGNSDHSSLSAVISMAQAVSNLCVSRKVFVKHQINWNTVCGAIRELPWHNMKLMKPTRRPSVSLVIETGMFL